MEFFKRALITLLLWFSLPLFAGDSLDTWHWRSPTPTGNQLRGVAWGGGRFVAVGNVGTILISTDGKEWTPSESGTDLDLSSVVYGGGEFIAIGALGEMLSSQDGKTWRARASGTFADLNAVAFGGGKWVAVGDFGVIVQSTNGIDWSVVSAGGHPIRDIVWGNGTFLAVGGTRTDELRFSASGQPFAAISTNGISWTPINPANGANVWIRSAGFGGGRFVISAVGGAILWSTDLRTWQGTSLNGNWPGFSKIAHGTNGFIGVMGVENNSAGGLASSSDGSLWEELVLAGLPESPASPLSGASFGPPGLVAVGGSTYTGSSSVIFSDDLKNWSNRIRKTVALPGAMTFTGEQFFAGTPWNPAESGLSYWRSKNGVTWNFTPGPGTGKFSLPTYGLGIFVAAGEAGQIGISTNARDWRLVDSGSTNSLNAIAFSGGRFVAVGELGTVLVSTDGTNWISLLTQTDARLVAVVQNGGKWVTTGYDAATSRPRQPGEPAVHGEGAVLVSGDGMGWSLAATNGWEKVVPFKTGFAAVGGQRARFSEDGTNWQTFDGNYPAVVWSLASSGTELLVDATTTFPGAIFSTSDGTNWNRHVLPVQREPIYSYWGMGGAAFGRNTWVLSFGPGLFQSEPFEAARPELVEQPLTIGGRTNAEAWLRIRAFGSSPLFYQWSRNGPPISGATNQFLALPASEDPTNRFRVTVSNAFGSTNSADVTITAPARPELKLVRQSSNWLEVRGTPGKRYVAQQSGDLGSSTNWTSIGLVEIDGDFPAYISVDLPAETNRFFRAVAEP